MAPSLWIFPPGHAHGWRSDRPCEVCMVHLASCPRLVADVAEARGFLHIPLGQAQRQQITLLDARVAQLLGKRPEAGEIAADLFRGLFAELALSVIDNRDRIRQRDGERTVKQALVWFEDHLHAGAGIAEAARALHVSPAHLRRLCHQYTGRSPRDLLLGLRCDRACALLSGTDQSLEQIAWSCGYQSAVALSQAFIKRFGERPGAWRRRQGSAGA